MEVHREVVGAEVLLSFFDFGRELCFTCKKVGSTGDCFDKFDVSSKLREKGREMSNDIFQIIYVSKALEDISYSDLKRILQSSKKHNKDNDITGILIFRDGLFLQFLEGDKSKVFSTISRIITDQRHNHFKVISERFSAKRTFNSWPMAFLDGDIHQESEDDILQKIFSDAFLTPAEENEVLLKQLEKISQNPKYLI